MGILKSIMRSLSNLLTRPKPITTIVLTYDANQLLDQLDRRYPEVLPSPTDDLGTIQYRAGQSSVVRTLKQLHARQQQELE